MPRCRVADGLELNYELFGDDGAPVVVLVRGTGADGTRWMPAGRGVPGRVPCAHLRQPRCRGERHPAGSLQRGGDGRRHRRAARRAGHRPVPSVRFIARRCGRAHIAIERPERVTQPAAALQLAGDPRLHGVQPRSAQALSHHRWRRLLLRGGVAAALQSAVHVDEHERLMGDPGPHEGASGHLRGTARPARSQSHSRPQRSSRRDHRADARHRRASSTTCCRWPHPRSCSGRSPTPSSSCSRAGRTS